MLLHESMLSLPSVRYPNTPLAAVLIFVSYSIPKVFTTSRTTTSAVLLLCDLISDPLTESHPKGVFSRTTFSTSGISTSGISSPWDRD